MDLQRLDGTLSERKRAIPQTKDARPGPDIDPPPLSWIDFRSCGHGSSGSLLSSGAQIPLLRRPVPKRQMASNDARASRSRSSASCAKPGTAKRP
jgi:hypothetical protein